MALAVMLCLALVPSSLSVAQWRTSQDAEICVTGTGMGSLDIAVCGRALGREDLSELDRASLHTARGKALRDSGNLSAALEDFDAALALNPGSASAFNERGIARDAGGQYRQALEDFQRAIALSPRFAAAYKNRAISHFYAGNLGCARADFVAAAALFDGDAEVHAFRGMLNYLSGRYRDAAEDFRRVDALALPYPYLPLWRYLAASAGGASRRAVLVAGRVSLLPGEWPKPLLDLYLGESDAASVVATLGNQDDSPKQRRRIAASHYYIAALEQLNHGHDQAIAHLENAITFSEHRIPERVLAEHALAHAGSERRSMPAADLSECRR